MPALRLSAICSGFPVAGIAQVTAGSAIRYLRKSCAQLAQWNSAAHSGQTPPPHLAEHAAGLERLVDNDRDAALGRDRRRPVLGVASSSE